MIKLKEILRERGLTMAQLSQMSNITPSNLSNYVNGKVSPTLETLNKIADALNIDVTELFKQKEEIRIYVEFEGEMYRISPKEIIEIIKNKTI